MRAELRPVKVQITALIVDGSPKGAALETTSAVYVVANGTRTAVEPQHVTTTRLLTRDEQELLAILLKQKEEQA